MRVNGEQKEFTGSLSLSEFLKQENYIATRIAVERNGEIVSKKDYDNVILMEDDVLEIVHFVGGG